MEITIPVPSYVISLSRDYFFSNSSQTEKWSLSLVVATFFTPSIWTSLLNFTLKRIVNLTRLLYCFATLKIHFRYYLSFILYKTLWRRFNVGTIKSRMRVLKQFDGRYSCRLAKYRNICLHEFTVLTHISKSSSCYVVTGSWYGDKLYDLLHSHFSSIVHSFNRHSHVAKPYWRFYLLFHKLCNFIVLN